MNGENNCSTRLSQFGHCRYQMVCSETIETWNDCLKIVLKINIVKIGPVGITEVG